MIWRSIAARIQSTPDSNYDIQPHVYSNLYLNAYLQNSKNLDSALYFAHKYLTYKRQELNKPVELINELSAVAYNFDINGETSSATSFYQQALALRKEIWGAKNAIITHELDSLICISFPENPFDFRYELYKVGDTSYTYYQSDSIAKHLSRPDASNEEYREAFPFYIAAKDQAVLYNSDVSHEFYSSVMKLARYFKEYDAPDSISIYCINKVLQDLEQNNKIVSADYADALSYLAELYHESQNKTAIAILLKALPVYEKIYGKKSEQYIDCLKSIAWRYAIGTEAKNYTLAVQYMLQAVEIAKATCGADNINFLMTKKELGTLYTYVARLDESEKTLLEVYKTYTDKFHPVLTDEELENICYKLNTVYAYKEEPSKWLYWLNKSLEIKIAKNDTLSNSYLNLLVDKINANQLINNWSEAKKYLDLGDDIFNRSGDTTSLDYAWFLSSKRNYYLHEKVYDKCDSLFLKAIPIYSKQAEMFQDMPSENNLSVQLEEYATFSLQIKDYEKAFRLIQNPIAFLKKWKLDSTSRAASTYAMLGTYFLHKNQPDSAIYNFEMAMMCHKNTFSDKSIYYYQAQADAGVAYWRLSHFQKAEEFLSQASAHLKDQMIMGMAGFSEKEKQTYNTKLNHILNKYHNLHHAIYQSVPATNTHAYNFILQSKGLLLNTSIYVEKQIKASADKHLQKTYADLKQTKTMLAKAYQHGKEQNMGISIDSLETKAARLEKTLSEQSNVFADFQKNNRVSFKEVQSFLQPSEAAIEYVSFPYFNGTDFTDSLLYAAYIVKAGLTAPVYVPLPGVAELVTHIQGQQISTRGGVVIGSQVRKESFKELYQFIWNPLAPNLKGITKVSLAPDGILNKVAFAALQDTAGEYLVNKYDLKILLSTKDLVRKNNFSQSLTSSALLFGGAQYDLVPPAIKDTFSVNRFLPRDLSGAQTWSYLPGTLSEVSAVNQILKQNSHKVTTLVGVSASEHNFKTLGIRLAPSIIHIATHGFYYPFTLEENKNTQQKSVYTASDNPLLRTGLLFSGANWSWQGKSVGANQEDGILTAYEFSILDLSATQLVVLSACETGVGEIQNGEGVYGLQRAIRQSGVSKMIVSLWPVPDKETAEMMQSFYSELVKGKEIRSAFKKAQMHMLKKYPTDPSLWAGFTLIE
jgi:CHAT domain-containing protein